VLVSLLCQQSTLVMAYFQPEELSQTIQALVMLPHQDPELVQHIKIQAAAMRSQFTSQQQAYFDGMMQRYTNSTDGGTSAA
jgi:hypothetical protein